MRAVLSVGTVFSTSAKELEVLHCQLLAVPLLLALRMKDGTGPQMSVSFMAVSSGAAGRMVMVRVVVESALLRPHCTFP